MPNKLARMALSSWNGLTPTLKPRRYGNFPLLTFFDEFGFSGSPLRQFRIANGALLWRVENQDELPASAQLINSPYDGDGQPFGSSFQP